MINFSNKQFVTEVAIPLVIVSGIVVFLLTLGQTKVETTDKSSKPTTSTDKTSTQATTTNPSQNNSTSNSSAADSSSDAGLSNKACLQLSLAAAQKLLGQSAHLHASDNQDTSDILTVTCSYTSGDNSVSLVIHISKTSLGASNNSLAFGSEKPPGVTDIPNYGQAAYWVSGSSELDVLSGKDWYIITREDGANLQEVQAVADALNSKL